MKPIALTAALAVALAAPVAGVAKDKGHGNGNKHYSQASAKGCPPGLAKKGNGCRPPGLAKKDRGTDDRVYRRDADRVYRNDGSYYYRDRDRSDRDYSEGYYDGYQDGHSDAYRVGDRIRSFDDLVLVRDPGRYGLDPYGTYYHDGRDVIRVDRETQQVLALVGLVSTLLGG